MKELALLMMVAASPAIGQTNVAQSVPARNNTATADVAPLAAPSNGQDRASTVAVAVATRLFPAGTYRKMLGPALTKMIGGMSDGVGSMPIGLMLKAAGLPADEAPGLQKATIDDIMAILDPYYKERLRRTMDAMFAAMIPIFESLEPDLRAGLATSLDARFSAVQLSELNGFFATSTGSAFASQQMLLFLDPAVMGRMQAAMPKVMQAMPTILLAATKASNDLPKAKTAKDLTPAELARLSAMIGTDREARGK